MTDHLLDQAAKDFNQHLSTNGDHILKSVYDDLVKVAQLDNAGSTPQAAQEKFGSHLTEFNQTVRQYLPGISITGLDDKGHFDLQKDGDKTVIAVDASLRLPDDIFTKNTNSTVDNTNKNDRTNTVNTNDGNDVSTQLIGKSTENTTSTMAVSVTKDSQGFAIDVKYPPNSSGKQHETKFDYDDSAGFHRLTKVTKDDGTTYELITNPKDANAGKWKVTDYKGSSTVQDLKVQIDLAGNWTRTENGKQITERADGTTDAPKKDDKAEDARKQLLELATQKVGEGPWQTAERLLPGASYDDLKQLTKLLKRYYQDNNDDKTDKLVKLKVGQHWLTDKNFEEILNKSKALKDRFDKLQSS